MSRRVFALRGLAISAVLAISSAPAWSEPQPPQRPTSWWDHQIPVVILPQVGGPSAPLIDDFLLAKGPGAAKPKLQVGNWLANFSKAMGPELRTVPQVERFVESCLKVDLSSSPGVGKDRVVPLFDRRSGGAGFYWEIQPSLVNRDLFQTAVDSNEVLGRTKTPRVVGGGVGGGAPGHSFRVPEEIAATILDRQPYLLQPANPSNPESPGIRLPSRSDPLRLSPPSTHLDVNWINIRGNLGAGVLTSFATEGFVDATGMRKEYLMPVMVSGGGAAAFGLQRWQGVGGFGGGLAGNLGVNYIAQTFGANANQAELAGAYGGIAGGFAGGPAAGTLNLAGTVGAYAGEGVYKIGKGCIQHGAGTFLYAVGHEFWYGGLVP